MAISKSKKVEILEQLKNEIATQKSVVLVNTKDTKATINAEKNFELRKAANNVGIKVQIVKNSLIKQGFNGVPDLSGQTYIAFLKNAEETNEVVVPKNFLKVVNSEFKDNLNLVGAIINGEFVDANQAVAYSKVNTFEESMAQVAGTLNAITAKIAMATKEIPAGLARSISEVAKQK